MPASKKTRARTEDEMRAALLACLERQESVNINPYDRAEDILNDVISELLNLRQYQEDTRSLAVKVGAHFAKR